jgi:hypothetical protein
MAEVELGILSRQYLRDRVVVQNGKPLLKLFGQSSRHTPYAVFTAEWPDLERLREDPVCQHAFKLHRIEAGRLSAKSWQPIP